VWHVDRRRGEKETGDNVTGRKNGEIGTVVRKERGDN
jgi:hypothetical protein